MALSSRKFASRCFVSEGHLERAEPNCCSLRLLVDLNAIPLQTRWLYRIYSVMCALIIIVLGCCSLTQTWPNCFTRNNVRAWGLFHQFLEISFLNLFPLGSSGWSSIYWGAFSDQNFKLSRWDMEREHIAFFSGFHRLSHWALFWIMHLVWFVHGPQGFGPILGQTWISIGKFRMEDRGQIWRSCWPSSLQKSSQTFGTPPCNLVRKKRMPTLATGRHF